METHIKTVVGRSKGHIHGWDVANEAILNDGSYRESKFYQIPGKEYIQLAFKFAYEADPEA
jgi:endo-1,4-beta-xylanase